MGISIWQILILLIILPLFFLPTIIAISRNHPHKNNWGQSQIKFLSY